VNRIYVCRTSKGNRVSSFIDGFTLINGIPVNCRPFEHLLHPKQVISSKVVLRDKTMADFEELRCGDLISSGTRHGRRHLGCFPKSENVGSYGELWWKATTGTIRAQVRSPDRQMDDGSDRRAWSK
jgi:hypothetical protein